MLIAFLPLAIGCAGQAPVGEAAQATTQQQFEAEQEDPCVTWSDSLVPQWRDQGMSPADVERWYQTALDYCAGEGDVGTAYLLGSANADLRRLAHLTVKGTITPGTFFRLARERVRKVRRHERDPEYGQAYLNGDADGDLVPDDRDRCPGTPDLMVTDETGCPPPQNPNQPQAPDPDPREVRRVLDSMNLVADPGCEGAPIPTVPRPLKLGYGNYAANVAVERASNQPTGCLVLYEIDVRLNNPGWATSGLPAPRYPHMVFRSTEDVAAPPIPDGVAVFRVGYGDPGDGGNRALFASELAQYQEVMWRARAFNGNGLRSSWSDWRRMWGPSAGSATPPFTVP